MTDIIDNSLINSTVSAEAGGGFSYEAVSLSNTGNKLRRVDDGADSLPIYAGAPDFPDGVGGSVEYEYDPNGNLTRDDNRGYTAAYNLLNLPAHIKGDDGTIIRNYYDTSGTLLRREVTTAFIAKTSESAQSSTLRPSFSETVTDDYVGDLVFTSPVSRTDPPTIRVVTPTGFVDTDGKVHSHVRDYQGNVRQVLDEEGNVEQSSDYYPYGMLMGESDLSATSSSPNPFRFGGKHYLTAASIFLHDFAARFYDAATITFTSHDAITTNSYPTNPFLYCNADPINFIDPTGMDEYTIGTNGALISQVKNDENDIVIIGDQRLTLPYGTIEYKKKSIRHNGEVREYSYYSVRGHKNGRKLFEFMANNCTVNDINSKGEPVGAEISWAEFEGGKNGLNVISSSSIYKTERSFLYLMDNNESELPQLILQVHSHHLIRPGDSKPNPSKDDVDNYKYIIKSLAKKGQYTVPQFYVYWKGIYSKYSPNFYLKCTSILRRIMGFFN